MALRASRTTAAPSVDRGSSSSKHAGGSRGRTSATRRLSVSAPSTAPLALFRVALFRRDRTAVASRSSTPVSALPSVGGFTRSTTPTIRSPRLVRRQTWSHIRSRLATSHAPELSSTMSEVVGRAACTLLSAASRLCAPASSADRTATTSGLPLVLTMPQTPSAETPRKWCSPPLMSIEWRTDATSLVGPRRPTGIESPETSSCCVSLLADTLAQDITSAKNCGVMVSRNSRAVGMPILLRARSCCRAFRSPWLIW
mmetsp:Transcript_72459/g.143888  ORF Transcript_72459/g.143888 Transcript_72459/m.143888 type:complete len:256 (-) Transcript_72459:352-1119(-)